MLDMDRRIAPVRRATFGVIALCLLLSGPWLGWWTIVPVVLAAIAFRLAEKHVEQAARPEWALFAAWVFSQIIIASSVALTGGPTVPTMAWLAIPLVTLGARFSERGIALGVGITLVLILAVAFGVNADAVIHSPPLLIAPIGLVIAVALLQSVLMRSDVDTRAEAIVDPLTGMLNRKALESRVTELTQQSKMTHQPVGMILGDIDLFKEINDTYGHAAGDAVLKDVAYTLRKALRAFDLVYRVGGEEFLVLLPGAETEQTKGVAEELRTAIAATPAGGQDMTMSFGVTASAPHHSFDYEELFAQADAALYQAKHEGRNCVFTPDGPAVPVLA